MLRVEAAIFASPKPVPREALVRLVGEACRFDDLIADLIHELRGRPYDLTLVAGGYALRTKTRFAPAIRAAHPGLGRDDVAELTRTETFALTAIAYLQPVTRGEISRLAGREISRDVIASLKRHGLIDGAIRAPQPGAPVRLCDDAEIPGGVRLRLPARPAGPRTAQGRTPAAERAGGGRPRQRARGHECEKPTTHSATTTRSWMMSRDYEGVLRRSNG